MDTELILKIVKQTGKVVIVLFPIIDILGNLPIIIGLEKKVGEINAEKASIVAALLMIIFLFVGNALFTFMGIPLPAFAVAGSFVLFVLAVEMILGVNFHKTEIPDSVSIVPIAFPLLAGPGVLTTILALRSLYHVEAIIGGIIINLIIVYVIMRNSKYIGRLLGDTGVVIVHKISGIILLAMSVKIFSENWPELFGAAFN
ncbi:MarC family protein [Ornithobacterium rhinotracheale]|uniref:MarC family protein n=1 Tax=Ornithobacterium rhinotracheale TaxID=28251 RepID=UPI00129CB26D|nr:MarC family protein [Ornithobacterium rhinotracheale]MRJ08569.1 MarC family protein [Ornithobacterium rhinotracheale]UOH76841.1 MarC family protein [Ornithobacterium rhinotracheale]